MQWYISAYRVQQVMKAGTEMTHSQHVSLVTQLGCIDPKPQEYWDNNFITFLATIPMEDEIFIGLNVNAGLNNSKFAKIVNSRNLQDIITTNH
eukprot:5300164-Ditylum_brightwellii.AAC.1